MIARTDSNLRLRGAVDMDWFKRAIFNNGVEKTPTQAEMNQEGGPQVAGGEQATRAPA